jgi:hypothetical protein
MADYEAYDTEAVDDSYEAVDDAFEAIDGEDFGERARRRRKGVPAAKGGSAYRAPVPSTYVTQKQLADALSRVGEDVKRNAAGIKALNGQVSDLAVTTKIQGTRLGKMDRLMKIDGALDVAQALTLTGDGTTGVTGMNVNLGALLGGAVKSGAFGDMKGTFGNPLVLAGIAFVLSNRQQIFKSLQA